MTNWDCATYHPRKPPTDGPGSAPAAQPGRLSHSISSARSRRGSGERAASATGTAEASQKLARPPERSRLSLRVHKRANRDGQKVRVEERYERRSSVRESGRGFKRRSRTVGGREEVVVHQKPSGVLNSVPTGRAMLEAEGTGPGCEIVSSSRSGQRGRERRICGRPRAEEPGISWKPAALLEEVEGKCPRLRRVAGVARVGR